MFGETYGQKEVNALVYALKDAEQSLKVFIETYPKDPEIKAHKIHLRSIRIALKGW